MSAEEQQQMANLMAASLGGDGMDEDGGMATIELTEEDRNAIEQLQAMGFSEQAAVEAYLACDRNADVAASYLFEHGGGMDDQ